MSHICSCEECHPEAFDDRCRFEEERDRYREALEAVRGIVLGDPGMLADRVVRRIDAASASPPKGQPNR